MVSPKNNYYDYDSKKYYCFQGNEYYKFGEGKDDDIEIVDKTKKYKFFKDLNEDEKTEFINALIEIFLSYGLDFSSHAFIDLVVDINKKKLYIIEEGSKEDEIPKDNFLKKIDDDTIYIPNDKIDQMKDDLKDRNLVLVNNEADGNCGFQSIRNSLFAVRPVKYAENMYTAVRTNQIETPQLLIEEKEIKEAINFFNIKPEQITYDNFVIQLKQIFARYFCDYVLNNNINCKLLKKYKYRDDEITSLNQRLRERYSEEAPIYINRYKIYENIMSNNYLMDDSTILFYEMFLKIKFIILDSRSKKLSICNPEYLFYNFLNFTYDGKDNITKVEDIKKITRVFDISSVVFNDDDIQCKYILSLYSTPGHFQSIFKRETDARMSGYYEYTYETINELLDKRCKENLTNVNEYAVVKKGLVKLFKTHNKLSAAKKTKWKTEIDNYTDYYNTNIDDFKKRRDEIIKETIEEDRIFEENKIEFEKGEKERGKIIGIDFIVKYIYIILLYIISFKLVYNVQNTEVLGFIVLFIVYIVSTMVLINDIENKESIFFMIICFSFLFTFFSTCYFVKMLVKIHQQNLKSNFSSGSITFIEPYTTKKNIYKNIFVFNVFVQIFLFFISRFLKQELFYWDSLKQFMSDVKKMVGGIFNEKDFSKRLGALIKIKERLKKIKTIDKQNKIIKIYNAKTKEKYKFRNTEEIINILAEAAISNTLHHVDISAVIDAISAVDSDDSDSSNNGDDVDSDDGDSQLILSERTNSDGLRDGNRLNIYEYTRASLGGDNPNVILNFGHFILKFLFSVASITILLPFYKLILTYFKINSPNDFNANIFKSIVFLLLIYLLISSIFLLVIALELSKPPTASILSLKTTTTSEENAAPHLETAPLYKTSFYPQNSVWTKLMSPFVELEMSFHNLNLNFLSRVNTL